MKTQLTIVCIFLSIMLSTAQTYQKSIPEDYGYKVELGQTVPNITLALPNGETTTTQALRGKVIMLQFTASWCSVCRKEMPHIEKDIWLKHKDNKDFALYGIDLKEDAAKVIEFQKAVGSTYPIALDLDGKIFDTFTQENAGVTRNIIINKEGKIVYMTRLFKQEEFDEMKEVIIDLLK